MVRLLTEILGAIAGAAAFIYGLGLGIIALSLYGKHIDAVSTTWYAASLVPNRLVAVYGLKGLLWPAGASVIFILLLTSVIVPAVAGLMNGPLAYVFPGGGWLTSIKRALIALPLVVLLMAVLWIASFMYLTARDLFKGSEVGRTKRFGLDEFADLLTCANSPATRFADSLAKDFPLCGDTLSIWFWIYLVSILLGSVIGIGLILYAQRVATPADRRRKLWWLGVSVIFLGSYLGAIALAVPREPPLPYVALVENEGKTYSPFKLQRDWQKKEAQNVRLCNDSPLAVEGILLGHYQAFWYVLHDGGNISAIPDNTKGLVAVSSLEVESCLASVTVPLHTSPPEMFSAHLDGEGGRQLPDTGGVADGGMLE